MIKKMLGILLFLLFINTAHAAMMISPERVESRYGFEVKFIEGEGDSYPVGEEIKIGEWRVIFEDGESCEFMNFIGQKCGTEYMVDAPCVSEGEPVWMFETCCEGTEAYLKPYHAGQNSCMKISIIEKTYNQFKYNPFAKIFFWVVITLIILAILIVYFVKRKK